MIKSIQKEEEKYPVVVDFTDPDGEGPPQIVGARFEVDRGQIPVAETGEKIQVVRLTVITEEGAKVTMIVPRIIWKSLVKMTKD